MQPTHAHLSEASPRYPAWQRVFRSTMVELESPIPILADLPGLGVRGVYKLKTSALAPDQRARLLDFLCERFNLPLDEACTLLQEHGCPILADDVSVSFDMRLVI